MTPNSAFNLVNIELNKDYAESDSTVPIFAIHCTKTNTGIVKLLPLGSKDEIEFPTGSFVQGAIYWIYVRKISDLGNGSFVGYKYASRPYNL